MKRMSHLWSLPFLLFTCLAQAKTGLLFNVEESGSPASADIILCLNGKGPASCQKYHVSANDLTISTTIKNNYPVAGIKVLTAGYTATECTTYKNGYCLFGTGQRTRTLVRLNPGEPTPDRTSKAQTLTFASTLPPTATYNTTFTVQATASSGLPVTYASSGVCTNNGTTYTMTSGTGSCQIIASQEGNDEYSAATNLTGSVTASLAFQQPPLSISSDATSISVGGNANLSTTGGSGTGTISFNLDAASTGCVLNGAVVTGTGGGTCLAYATKAADSDYQLSTSTAVSITVNATPASPPNPPTNVTAVINNGQAPVSWTAPSNDGGSAIIDYTATASDGSSSCTANAPTTQCTVLGLTNDTPYTYTVTARNSVGVSADSATSAPVTPTFVQVLVNLDNTTGYFGSATNIMGSFTEFNGDLYGVAPAGGTGSAGSGDGTIFKISTIDHSFSVLANFQRGGTGSAPYGKLLYVAEDGYFYGTTSTGGLSYNQGTVFRFSPVDNSLTVMAEFAVTNGSVPLVGLMKASDGYLYGTTTGGNPHPFGGIYRIAPGGNSIMPLAWFDDAVSPTGTGTSAGGTLVQIGDDLYGATGSYGPNNAGAVFKFNILSGTPAIDVAAAFDGSTGQNATAGLLKATSNTNLYGVTLFGPAFLYKLTPPYNTITPMASFDNSTGLQPATSLIQDSSDGSIYGTAYSGGNGGGTIFKFDPVAETLNSIFSFVTSTGTGPLTGLVLANGKLYGMTQNGGTTGLGTIFVVYPPFV